MHFNIGYVKIHRESDKEAGRVGKRFDMAFRMFAVTLISVASKIRYRTRRLSGEKPSKGALLVCSHSSISDYFYDIYALYPRADMRFLATAVHYDKSKFVSAVFRHLGMIRKNQGARDLQSIKEMIKASREGGMVVVYAAGMTSFDGRPGWSALPGIGSLPKLLKSDVYTAVAHGGFISHPRYGAKHRGRVEVEIKRLYTADEAAKLDAAQLQDGINKAIYFNDWDWQAIKKQRFSRMKRTENLSRTLYMCPECGAEGEMGEENGLLRCKRCGYAARRDKYGFFAPENGKGPTRMDEWADMEIARVKKELESDAFSLSARATLYSRRQNRAEQYACAGEGELSFTKAGLRFKGEAEELVLPLSAFQFFVYDDIRSIIINTEEMNYRFEFADPRLITKWYFADRLLQDTQYGNRL